MDDASGCPIVHSGLRSSVVKDPLPVDDVVDPICLDLLNDNRTVIRKYPEAFLCVAGLSRTFTETDVRPTFLYSNDKEMGLLDFVKFMYPYKVKVGKKELLLRLRSTPDETKVNTSKRRKRVTFVSESPPVKKAKAKGVVILESWAATVGKSPTILRRLIKQSGQTDIGSGSAAVAMEDFVSSSATPTPLQDYEDAY
ncbi:hypothetical protein Tco_1212875 [Tanacetum coccineum]